MITKNNLLRIVKYLNYIYITSYVKNSLKINKYNEKNNEKNNEWKIFSTHFNIKQQNYEQFNILHLIQSIISRDEFDYNILLISIYIYKKICINYADLIDNYIYLFGSVYITMNKILCDNFLDANFLSIIFDIELKIITKMIKCIDNFINNNDIYFSIDEKNKIIDGIYYAKFTSLKI